MVYLFKVGQRHVASGIPWERQDVAHLQQQDGGTAGLFRRRRAAGKTDVVAIEHTIAKARKAVLIAGSGNMPVRGFLTKADKKALAGARFAKVYPLAEAFSRLPNLPPCSILVAPIDGEHGQYALCVVMSGAPAPDAKYDLVLPVQEVRAMLSHWRAELGDQYHYKPVIYGTWEGDGDIGIDVATTLDQVFYESRGYGYLRSASGTEHMMAAVAGAALVCAGLYFAYDTYSERQRAKIARANAVKKNPQRQYMAALEKNWGAEPWGSRQAARIALSTVENLPRKLAGFTIDGTVSCVLEEALCAGNYARTEDNATYDAFMAAAKSAFPSAVLEFGLDGKKIAVKLPLSLPQQAAPPLDWRMLPTEESLGLTFWSEAQQNHPKVRVVLTPKFTLFPSVPGVAESALHHSVRTTPVSVSFPLKPVFTDEMPPATPLFAGAISWKKVSAVSGEKGSFTITMEGDLYVKKGDL